MKYMGWWINMSEYDLENVEEVLRNPRADWFGAMLLRLIAKAGKAQPMNAKILTSNGWKLMKDINMDTLVIGIDGNLHKIIGIFPQGEKIIFKIKFSDGSSTRCTE